MRGWPGSAVFPMPAAPRTSRGLLRPARVRVLSCSMASRSARRPTRSLEVAPVPGRTALGDGHRDKSSRARPSARCRCRCRPRQRVISPMQRHPGLGEPRDAAARPSALTGWAPQRLAHTEGAALLGLVRRDRPVRPTTAGSPAASSRAVSTTPGLACDHSTDDRQRRARGADDQRQPGGTHERSTSRSDRNPPPDHRDGPLRCPGGRRLE